MNATLRGRRSLQEDPRTLQRFLVALENHFTLDRIAAYSLLLLMVVLSGTAAAGWSVTSDEVAHIGAGVSYLHRLDLRLNPEHPPLPKVIAAVPLVLQDVYADYSHVAWTGSADLLFSFAGEWVFGDYFLTRWNDPIATLAWARFPMLLLTLALAVAVWLMASRLSGPRAGLLALSLFVSSPVFLAFGPLVLTDVAAALFSLLAIWAFIQLREVPSRSNTILLAICLAAALLSKFSTPLLLIPFALFSVRPRERRHAFLWSVAGAGAIVYGVYFVLAWNQTTSLLDSANLPAFVERLLMPPVLYLTGFVYVLMTSNRATFLLGQAYSQGVWYYFPILFLLKSTVGFLGVALIAAIKRVRVHPVILVCFLVFTAACLLSRLNISYRHFMLPYTMLILMVAPVANYVPRWLTAGLAAASLTAAILAYPHYIPYLNVFALGREPYTLVNDSNVDWNHALPAVQRFASERGIDPVRLDYYGITDPRVHVPAAQVWDCQKPSPSDAGQWVVVSANVLLDGHDCRWLTRYRMEPIAGGSMYAIRLPATLPVNPSPNPRNLFALPYDLRPIHHQVMRDPSRLPAVG